jgi:hypothetical protein
MTGGQRTDRVDQHPPDIPTERPMPLLGERAAPPTDGAMAPSQVSGPIHETTMPLLR